MDYLVLLVLISCARLKSDYGLGFFSPLNLFWHLIGVRTKDAGSLCATAFHTGTGRKPISKSGQRIETQGFVVLRDLHVVKHFAVFELFVCVGLVFFPFPSTSSSLSPSPQT